MATPRQEDKSTQAMEEAARRVDALTDLARALRHARYNERAVRELVSRWVRA
jgi:hypothetical protein